MLSGEQFDLRPSIYGRRDQTALNMLDHVQLPAHVSPEARSLTAGLLEIDPLKRLGSSHSPHGALRDHAFFSVGRKINWESIDECSHESINRKLSVGKVLIPTITSPSCDACFQTSSVSSDVSENPSIAYISFERDPRAKSTWLAAGQSTCTPKQEEQFKSFDYVNSFTWPHLIRADDPCKKELVSTIPTIDLKRPKR